MIYQETSGTIPGPIFTEDSGPGGSLPPQTSGNNSDIFGTNSPKQHASWGLSWGFTWGNSWGFIRYTNPFDNTSGTSSQQIYEVS